MLRLHWALFPVLVLCMLEASAAPIDVESVASRNMGSVLVIHGQRADTGVEVQGSGCCISADGYVLATAHQAEGVKDFVGRLSDGTKVKLALVESRPAVEFALFKSEVPLPQYAMLGDAEALKSGTPLVSIAAPMDLEFSTVSGTVANPNRSLNGYSVLQVALTASHGSSGGPVFDRNGKLIGLISGGLSDVDFTIVNKINNAFPLLSAHGVQNSGLVGSSVSETHLEPALGASESEIQAIEAYNQGVAASNADEKIKAYQRAASLWPDFYEACFNLALVEAGAGATAEAITHYKRAAEIRPEGVAARRNLGRLYLREKRYEEAIGVFKEAVKLAPDEAQGHNDLGEACRRAGQLEEATAHFEASLRLDDTVPGAHYNLALSLAAQGRGPEAIKQFDAYLALSPQASDADDVRAWIQKLKTP